MRIKSLLIAAIAMGAVFGASPASAALMMATWQTTILRVGQPVGVSPATGPVAGEIPYPLDDFYVGTPLTFRYVYDTNLGSTSTGGADGPYSFINKALVRAEIDYANGLLAKLDLTDYRSQHKSGSRSDSGPFAYTSYDRRGEGGAFVSYFLLTSQADRAPMELSQPFTTQFTGAGRFTVNRALGAFEVDFSSTASNRGTLTVERLDTAVPEPASWAIMISGFGLAGSALRRRTLTA